jgi:TolB-like protein
LRIAGGAALFVAILAGVYLIARRTAPAPSSALPRTLAVLPFRAISAEGMPEHFGLGLADSLIGRLASLRELTVRPTSAIARYETATSDASEIGRRLGVDAVLEGTYQKLEGMTRISVQMTDVSKGGILWSEQIDLAEGKLFELQDAISRQVAEHFRIQLAPSMQRTLGPPETVPDRIMEQYLVARARLVFAPTTVADEREQIAAAFDPIVEQAPNFARAIGARAYARATLAFIRPSPERWSAAVADADRALALDPDLAEPRLARAFVAWSSFGGWDVVKAVRELKRAISVAPNLEMAHFDLARIYLHSGWLSEFETENNTGERINPSGAEAERQRATRDGWGGGGDLRKALEHYNRLPPETRRLWSTRWPKDWVRAMLEDPREIEPEIESLRREASDDMKSAYTAILALVRARQGRDFADLETEALAADRRMGHFHHVYQFLAEAHAIRGDVRRAVELIGLAVKSGMPCGPCFDQDAVLKPLRESPEYAAVRAEIDRRNAADRAALKDVL